MADQIQGQQREQLTGQLPRNVEPENDGNGKTQMDLEVPKETNSARDSKHGNSDDPREKSSEHSEKGNSKDFIEKRNSEYLGNGNSENSGSGSADGPQEGNTTDPGDRKSVGLEKVNSEDLKKENSKDPQKGNLVVSGTGNSENPREVSHRSKKHEVDSKDGNNSVTTAQELSIHHNESELRQIWISERMEHPRKIMSKSSGGFLRATKANERSGHIPVDFTVKSLEQTTEFYIEKNNKYEANTFRCCIGDQQYYLCTEEKNVFLLNADAYDPNDVKCVFRTAFINPHSKFRAIKLMKTEMFLVSDEHGNASMREIKDLNKYGQPEDRQAWFEFLSNHEDDNDDDDIVICKSMLTISTFTAETCEA